ncbi:MAG: PQQ-binding-like beta-propeller repeat protein [Planctomycetota bacterium]
MTMDRCLRRIRWQTAIVLAAALSLPALAAPSAREVLDATGVQGGLVVHLGCGDGTLTAALRASDSYLVHGLDGDPANVAKARKHVHAQGLYGPVAIDRLRGTRLPYTENLVRLVVTEDRALAEAGVTMAEVGRVLAPDGVAYVQRGGQWTKTVKPRPGNIDEWTHYLHDPSNNAVAEDTVVGPPRHLQWVASPRFARSHDHLASVSAVVSSGGRLFAIVDEGPRSAVVLPPQWRLVARDAFSGVVLWKRDIPVWEWHLRGFRSGPPEIARRLVAVGDTVYATLGYGAPVSALDAATGKTLREYGETKGAREFVVADGRLYVVAGDATLEEHLARARRRREDDEVKSQRPAYGWAAPRKRLVVVDADSGEVVWQKADADTVELMPTTVAVADGRCYFQSPSHILCLEAATGREVWRAERPTAHNRLAWTAPTLVVHDGVVLSADRAANSVAGKGIETKRTVDWVVSSAGGRAPVGKLIAYSAKDGQRLWDCPAKECYNAPVDVLVAGGLVWTGNLVRAGEPGITQGRDPRTGQVKSTRPKDQQFFSVGMNHHRCHRNKATSRYLVLGRAGVEFIDLGSGRGVANHWTRGGCQYGVMPCNGLLYCPSHSCACYIEAKINGFFALAPERKGPGTGDEGRAENGSRLEKGPAFGSALDTRHSALDTSAWPTYRHDPARTGATQAAVPAQVEARWQAKLGGKLSSVTVAGGKLFVARIDAHTVHALDAASGEPLWQHTAGGRVDSPPTVHRGLAILGSADGTVTCLRAEDGALVWRFRAGPEDRRVVSFDQVESAWPVHGSVLVEGGAAHFVAGRSAYLDGGLYLYRLDPQTGKTLSETRIRERDPKTGHEPPRIARGTYMPGTLPDVLSSDGQSVFMRHRAFDLKGQPRKSSAPHLFCSVGFLDDTWWHRTYWQVGTKMGVGYGGWPHPGNRVPAGRILAVADGMVYGFGRNWYIHHGAHVGLDGATVFHFRPPRDKNHRQTYYRLFACSTTTPEEQKGKRRRGPQRTFRWQERLPMFVRAMVLAGDTLFVAGPPNPVLVERGKLSGEGARLVAVSAADGKTLAEVPLDAAPAWDAMAAAGGRLYLSTQDGRVLCFGGEQ